MFPNKLCHPTSGIIKQYCVILFVGILLLVLQKFYFSKSKKFHTINCRVEGPLTQDDPDLIKFLITNNLYPPSTEPYNLTSTNDLQYLHKKNKYNWIFIHNIITQLFENITHGFFIEAGALDGEFLSNSLWLEKNLHWTGLLIEPDPLNFKHLKWKNRKAWLSDSCVSMYIYPYETIMRSLLSLTKSHGNEWLYRAQSFIISKLDNLQNEFANSAVMNFNKVQCYPLYTYMVTMNVTVDLLSLDTQGGEWEAIKSIPNKTLLPRVIVVEHIKENKTNTDIDFTFVQFMKYKGYYLVKFDDLCNYIYVLESDTQLMNRILTINYNITNQDILRI